MIDKLNVKKDVFVMDMMLICNEEVILEIMWKDVGKVWDIIVFVILVFVVLVFNSVYFVVNILEIECIL